MARSRKKPEGSEAHEATEGAARQPNGERAAMHDLEEHRQMLAEAKAEQERMKAAQDIVFVRGVEREAKKEQLVKLGYSSAVATKILLQKQDEDQYGNPVVRPGFTRAERAMAASNVRFLDQEVKRLEGNLGVRHQAAEERRDHERPPEGPQVG